MIKVLLADDEPIILRGLRKLVPWEQMGMTIVGEVEDGAQLAAVLLSDPPDILVSDIQMPNLSGIEVIKRIKDLNLEVKVIFISAYKEFSYARDAVSCGALGYLVKPIDRRELEETLRSAQAQILKEREDHTIKERLLFWEERKRQEMEEEMLDRLLDGRPVNIGHLGNRLGDGREIATFTVAAMEPDQPGSKTGSWRDEDKNLVVFAIRNVLYEMTSRMPSIMTCFRDGRFFLVFLDMDPDAVLAFAADVQHKINTYLKLDVSIGIGGSVQTAAEVPVSGRQAIDALRSKFFRGLNRLLPWKPLTGEMPSEKELYENQQAVICGLSHLDWEAANIALDQLLRSIERMTFGNKELAVNVCVTSLFLFVRELKNASYDLEEWEANPANVHADFNRSDTYQELQMKMRDRIGCLFRQLQNSASHQDKQLIQKIKRYVETQYMDEITLESAAALAYMNPYYFSAFFKKHMGKNFKQYVTEVRMKEAVRLLLQTDLMVYEIAERVGYQNARHFSGVFRKMYGKLPNDYRQEQRAKWSGSSS
ncbi:response regulator [Thermobacillus sp.]|uniref:response regulator n=1 Tax=Thermobacillus sp. TaxID=2108467 RepID=UPI002579E862|nr:response regulator [Thermobacillus sp.]